LEAAFGSNTWKEAFFFKKYKKESATSLLPTLFYGIIYAKLRDIGFCVEPAKLE